MKIIIQVLMFFCLFVLQAYTAQGLVPFQTIIPENQKKETRVAYSKLKWEADMDYAFQRARNEHKNVMIMVEEPGCKWCVKMKKGALSDQNVQNMLDAYVLIKVQRSDKSKVEQIEDFDGAIPSFHFMQPDKERIETVIGYFETEDFLSYLCDIETDN